MPVPAYSVRPRPRQGEEDQRPPLGQEGLVVHLLVHRSAQTLPRSRHRRR